MLCWRAASSPEREKSGFVGLGRGRSITPSHVDAPQRFPGWWGVDDQGWDVLHQQLPPSRHKLPLGGACPGLFHGVKSSFSTWNGCSKTVPEAAAAPTSRGPLLGAPSHLNPSNVNSRDEFWCVPTGKKEKKISTSIATHKLRYQINPWKI